MSALVFALAASPVLAQDDPCQAKHSTQSSCDADTTTGGGCTWCKCAALPSACWTLDNAKSLPSGVYQCDSTEKSFHTVKYAVDDEPCLTPTQEKQLKEAITGIRVTLNSADAGLLIAAAAEKNETIKARLLLAEKIISAINMDIVNNLTKIANEACGNCSQIVETVTDAVNSLEEALTKIEPDWKTDPIFEAVVAAVSAILAIVADFCPNTVVSMLGF